MVNGEESVTTPAGTFTAMKLTLTIITTPSAGTTTVQTITHWYVKNIGRVKYVTTTTSGGTTTTTTQVLRSYSQPPGSPFVSADFQGTWHYKSIVSGDTSGEQLPGWVYGSLTFDGSGKNTASTPIVDSAGTAPYTPTVSNISIDSKGMITPTLGGTGRWIMTQNEDTMVFVGTGALGSITGVRGYNLVFFTKEGSNFSSADLQGTWNITQLNTGVNTGWYYGSQACANKWYMQRNASRQ
jgi:hypothetical protein